jgi:hypothetical protein
VIAGIRKSAISSSVEETLTTKRHRSRRFPPTPLTADELRTHHSYAPQALYRVLLEEAERHAVRSTAIIVPICPVAQDLLAAVNSHRLMALGLRPRHHRFLNCASQHIHK